jgi:hypothetical protein
MAQMPLRSGRAHDNRAQAAGLVGGARLHSDGLLMIFFQLM